MTEFTDLFVADEKVVQGLSAEPIVLETAKGLSALPKYVESDFEPAVQYLMHNYGVSEGQAVRAIELALQNEQDNVYAADTEATFDQIVGDDVPSEELLSYANNPDVQAVVNNKLTRLTLFAATNSDAMARFVVRANQDMQKELIPLLTDLGVPVESLELVIGLAEDIATKKATQND